MMQATELVNDVITEKDARQLEQSLRDAQTARLGALNLMGLTDADIREEVKHDPLYITHSLREIKEGLAAHRRVMTLMEAAVDRLEGAWV